MIKYFFSLFINHFSGTSWLIIIVNCCINFLFSWIGHWWRRWVFNSSKSCTDSFVPIFFLFIFFISTSISFILLRTVFSLDFSWRILFECSPRLFYKIVNMKIVKLPSNVMNSSENIKPVIVERHGVSVSNCRYISIRRQKLILRSFKIEHPQIIKSVVLIFSTKNVNILTIGCTSKAT